LAQADAERYEDGDENTVTVAGWHLYHGTISRWSASAGGGDLRRERRLVIIGFPEVTRMFSPALLKRTG
jgi:hypothetical protein